MIFRQTQMNRRQTIGIFLAVAIATLVVAGTRASAHADLAARGGRDIAAIWKSTETFSHGLVDRILALPSAVVGYTMAKQEIARGKPCLYMWGLPPSWRQIYAEIIQQRYSVQSKVVAGCVVNHFELARWSAHNAVIHKEIQARFGEKALAAAATEAESEYQRRYRDGTLPWQVRRRERQARGEQAPDAITAR